MRVELNRLATPVKIERNRSATVVDVSADADGDAIDAALARRRAIAAGRELARGGEGARVRNASGLTTRDVAAMVGVTAATVLRWERAGDPAAPDGHLPRGANAARYHEVITGLAARLAAGGDGTARAAAPDATGGAAP